ncbi:MAG: hypothetical protein HY278_11310 [candidate division NC10 bacterium]|nr:hypothetical protein [candidate division NC10 bacterium]
MNIQYDPLLAETVVLQEIARRQELGDPALFREYHVAADPLYHRRPDARDAAFQRLHAQFFTTLGFAEILQAELRRFPSIEAQASEVIVALAAGSHEEGADLSIEKANGNGQPAKRVGIRLTPDRFLDLPSLQRYLHHELLHIVDLLDPEFGYEGEIRLAVVSPADENIIRNRYRLLWCLSVDARLAFAGREPLADRETRRREFDAQYRKFAPAVRAAIFERLWQPLPLSHRLLLQMATGSEALLRLAGDAGQTRSESPRRVPLPGSPCPLCRFPSYHFVEDHTILDSALVTEIRRDFPSFRVDDSLCERCLEVYTLRAGRW